MNCFFMFRFALDGRPIIRMNNDNILLFFSNTTDCSFDCHKQCSTQIPNNCRPDKKLVKRVFGVDLTTLIKAHNQRRPQIVESCVHEIEKRGLELEGLYRVPGFADDITFLRNQIDKGWFLFAIFNFLIEICATLTICL